MSFLKKAVKSIGKVVGGLLGIDTGAEKALYQQQERQLQAAQEARKLETANEYENVVKFDDVDTGGTTTEPLRRKRRQVGGIGESLGLQL